MVIQPTRHLHKQLKYRFKGILTVGKVKYIVNNALSGVRLYPGEEHWVRLANLDEEVRFTADTKDGEVNGDTLIAVVRWNKKHRDFRIVTVLLRREEQKRNCDFFWEPDTLTSVVI